MTLWTAALVSLLALGAGARFTVSRLPVPEGMEGSWTARLDGDALEDMVVGVLGKDGERELRIFLQRPDGGFLPEPDRRVALKSDILALSMADVRPEPGAELLFFTSSGCFSYSTATAEYAGNARKMFSFDLLSDVRDPDDFPFVKVHPAGAAGPLVILPGPRGYGVFGLLPPEERGIIPASPASAEGQPRPGKVTIGTTIGDDDPFPGLVILGERARGEGGGRFLHVDRWLPAPAVADMDGDGRADIVYRNRTAGLLCIRFQGAGGKFEGREWTGTFGGDGPLLVRDLDGDGAADLMACDPKDSDQQTYRLFRNRGGRFEIEKPDGIMKFSGYRMKVSVLDLDGDGRPELAVSSYEIPAAGALAGGRVVRRLFIYRSEPERLFSQRPALKHEETFGARDVKGIGQRLFLDADLLGRRVHDALLVDREGSLAAIHLTPELSLESAPFWSFMPEKVILRIEAADLNGDSRSDLILHHKNLLTVLVSRP